MPLGYRDLDRGIGVIFVDKGIGDLAPIIAGATGAAGNAWGGELSVLGGQQDQARRG
ncbi:MAG: hypothetical protein GXY70_08840 [Euryarchaeota archaeon]|nr:hypothetical protein [Euryarchaeota archaeon]